MNNNTNRQNILIVDDNAKNIQLAANVLKSTDAYNIFFATSGEKGIEQLSIRDYSLILLDVNMPGLNGFETALIIKNTPETKPIPIVFLSANANKESIRKGFEHGGEDYITKPFDEFELIHRVKTHVELYLTKLKLQREVDDTKVLLEQYKLAVDTAAFVSKVDLDGNITYVNDNFCKLSKYSREELIGINFKTFRSPDISDEVYCDLWTTIRDKKTWNHIIKNIAKDGSAYYCEETIIPILDSYNEITEYISLRTDMTKAIELKVDIIDTQKEILYTFGELGEWRSKETGDHVHRVALYSEVLAIACGYEKHDVELLKMASPMHDIGKVIISDSILLKPAKLTYEEMESMKKHTEFGWEIFHKSKHPILQTAAIISHQHHEKWDGSGYPRGLKGNEIHIFGRITALADVFDALSHDRVYKKAWSIKDTLEYIKNESGKSFEPKLVDIFIENIDEILEIKRIYDR